MIRLARMAPYGLTIVLAIALAMGASDAAALTANPDGEWSGTVKCPNGKYQNDLFPIATLGPYNIVVGIDGSLGFVINRFGTGFPDALYVGAYFPDLANPATKGTLGFALIEGFADASETGQAKLETKAA